MEDTARRSGILLFLGNRRSCILQNKHRRALFDAVISVDTDHTSTVTSHPVQSGANMSDHMYENPVTITMEIAMSDAMDSMVHGQWHNAGEKGVSAYRTLRDLQKSRIPIDVLDPSRQVPEYGHSKYTCK
ncbi:MAG: phage baseplate protein [Dialister invisus]|uniref:phage baseplate protein n=1 Tax=Dialister invisus TaxID=218538 RepID=UPI003999BF0E